MKNNGCSKVKTFILFCLSIFLFFGLVSCEGGKQGVTPSYEGMTISKQETTMSRKLNKHDEDDKENGKGHDHHKEIEEDIAEVVEIEIITDDSVKYFVKPNEVFIVEIHISNPNDYEIQSFTLNGEKYANYMFKDGSTMELLLLEVTAPSEPGYYDYTIDAIKYIDGEEIKNVDMSTGEKTVKIGVSHSAAPSAQVVSSKIDTTSIELNIDLVDTENVIEEEQVSIYLSDGEEVVDSQFLLAGSNTVKFENLHMNAVYEYGILAVYDMKDGTSYKEQWLLTETFFTKAAFALEEFIIDKESIAFNLVTNDSNSTITSISLYDKETDEIVHQGNADTREFRGLLTDHIYYIRVEYDYVLNEETLSDYIIYEDIETKSKSIPVISFMEVTSDKTSISYKISKEDTDAVIKKINVVLIKDNEQVKDNGSVLEGTFTDLLSNTAYTIKVLYEYDLNDGKGTVSGEVEKAYTTIIDKIGIEEIVVLNNGIVRVGEEMNLRIYFDNPSDIELTGIYVNGQLVEVVGGNRKSNAIIKFIPETEGEMFNFYVDQVTYLTHDVEIIQEIDSEISAKYPIYGEIINARISPLSLTPYINTLPYFMFEFDNSKTNYKIYSFNGGDSSFVQLEDDKFIVSGNQLTSIEYWYEGYEVTSQEFSKSFSIYNVNPDVVYIYTEEDLILAEGNNYFILMNDLDFSKKSGLEKFIFNGILDGNGHTIKGLSIVKETKETQIDVGLFSSNSVIYNLNLEEIYLSYKIKNTISNMFSFAGTILGEAKAFDCKIEGDMNIEYNFGNFSVNSLSITNELKVNYHINGDNETIVQNSLGGGKENKYIHLNNCHYLDIGNDQYMLLAIDPQSEVIISDKCRAIACRIDNLKEIARRIIFPENAILFSNVNISCERFTKLEEIVLPKGITSIGRNAFRACSSLTSIVIPEGATNIGEYAFASCTNLTSIVIPNSVTIIGKGAFYGCSSLTSIVIPEGVTNIGEYAFADCTNLTSIVIPEGVTSIGDSAFDRCTSLEKVVFPSTLISVGDKAQAFDLCSIKDIYYNGTIEEWNDIDFYYAFNEGFNLYLLDENGDVEYNNNKYKLISELVIPEGVTNIGKYAFTNCLSLERVTLPSTLTNMERRAFWGCSNLVSVEILEGITSIGERAFYMCKSLKNIKLPEGITSIGEYAFSHCLSLERVTLPSTLINIGSQAFYRCRSLTGIEIPNNVATIGEEVFSECRSLTSIVIPNNVTIIGKGAFYDCSSLTIYCETLSKLSGWESDWNSINRPVYWAGEWEYDENGKPMPLS